MKSEEYRFSGLHDEFVLIGPVGEKDRILARSDAAGMDLIGYAMDKHESEDRDSVSTSFIDTLIAPRRRIHRVTSWPAQNQEPEKDSRKSSYRFAWVGRCRRSDFVAIEKSFNANIIDVSRAIAEDDRQQLELSLSPVLLRCSRANERALRRQRMLGLLMGIYVVIFGAMVAAMYFTSYLK